MSDERYDRSADMRLLDLQRKALGVPERVVGSTTYTDPDPLGDLNREEDERYVQSGTILVAAADARPRAGLIAGAVVMISLSVVNDGDVAGSNVRTSLPLPADTAYRPGTLVIDGAPSSDEIASEFFSNGMDLGDIEPGSRRSLTVKLVIEAGTSDIILTPHLSAASGAIIGLRAMRLKRNAPSARIDVADLPFYESDEAEHQEEPLAPPVAPPTIAVVQPRELPPVLHASPPMPHAPPPVPHAPPPESPPRMAPVVTEPTQVAAVKVPTKRAAPTPAKVAPKPRVKAKAKAKAKAPVPVVKSGAGRSKVATSPPIVETVARPKIEVVRSVDERISFTGQGGPILSVRIDRKRLSTLTGLFSGASLGMIAHYLVLNALAARDPLPGDGVDGSIAAFVASQEHLLSRALITTRLGKTPTADSVGATLPAFPPALAMHTDRRAIDTPPPGEAMLFRAFQPTEVAFVQRMLSNETAAPFMRAAQLFVGLCANDAIVADEAERRRVGVALTAYAALATGEISRIFLRAKLSGTPALFKATDSAFDDAAKTVLAALGRLIV